VKKLFDSFGLKSNVFRGKITNKGSFLFMCSRGRLHKVAVYPTGKLNIINYGTSDVFMHVGPTLAAVRKVASAGPVSLHKRTNSKFALLYKGQEKRENFRISRPGNSS